MSIRIWHQSFTVLGKLPAYEARLRKHIDGIVRPDTEVVLHGMHPETYKTTYPGHDIRYNLLFALHANQFVLNGLAAQEQGFDVYAISTLPDPMLLDIRSALDIPVVGYGESSMHLACMYGRKFGMLTFIEEQLPFMEERVASYGLTDRFAGVRNAGFTFDDLLANFNDPAPVIRQFEESARALIREGADVIIPGEVPMGVTMAAHGVRRVDDVPLLDGLAATMKMAELMVDLRRSVGLEVSRGTCYTAAPPTERLAELLAFYGHDRLMPGRGS